MKQHSLSTETGVEIFGAQILGEAHNCGVGAFISVNLPLKLYQ